MTYKPQLDDHVWWFQADYDGEIILRNGTIHGMRWHKAKIRKRKLILIDHHEVYVQFLHPSKESAIKAMIAKLESSLED